MCQGRPPPPPSPPPRCPGRWPRRPCQNAGCTPAAATAAAGRQWQYWRPPGEGDRPPPSVERYRSRSDGARPAVVGTAPLDSLWLPPAVRGCSEWLGRSALCWCRLLWWFRPEVRAVFAILVPLVGTAQVCRGVSERRRLSAVNRQSSIVSRQSPARLSSSERVSHCRTESAVCQSEKADSVHGHSLS